MGKKTKIFVSGVGGQGSITATLVIGEAAAAADLNVVSSEIHGMAQRGGIVETTVLIGDVQSAIIPDGGADIMLGFEPAEAARFVKMVSKEKTIAIVNERPIIPVSVSQGRETYPKWEELKDFMAQNTKGLYTFDGVGLATEAGTAKAVGTVMVGALAGLAALPIAREHWMQAMLSQVPKKYKDANIKAFDLGFAQTAQSS
jgi:indolepyruvate ferredoxin oxidoreductase beta subunit